MDFHNTEDGITEEPIDGVHITHLVAGEKLNMLHYSIEPASVVPEHSHHQEQVGYVTQGKGTFTTNEKEVTLAVGDTYFFPSNQAHRVENIGDESLEGIDIFSPPRLDI